ncbi:MAG: hypothetical protein MJY91_03915 [Bacteroidales bacterium]|nr:hypothetical protein [Bacteroidales bacterium]
MKQSYTKPEVRLTGLDLEGFLCNVSIRELKLTVEVDEYDIKSEEEMGF